MENIMYKTDKFMTSYLKIITESTNIIKSEHIEKIGQFDVKFIEFENGKWNYQLNQKYDIECYDPEDPSWDIWYPDVDAMDLNEFFDSLEEAKQEANIDIDNQLSWGRIKPC